MYMHIEFMDVALVVYSCCTVPMSERQRSDVSDGVSWWCPGDKNIRSGSLKISHRPEQVGAPFAPLVKGVS